jgi:hypothetical protein
VPGQQFMARNIVEAVKAEIAAIRGAATPWVTLADLTVSSASGTYNYTADMIHAMANLPADIHSPYLEVVYDMQRATSGQSGDMFCAPVLRKANHTLQGTSGGTAVNENDYWMPHVRTLMGDPWQPRRHMYLMRSLKADVDYSSAQFRVALAFWQNGPSTTVSMSLRNIKSRIVYGKF